MIKFTKFNGVINITPLLLCFRSIQINLPMNIYSQIPKEKQIIKSPAEVKITPIKVPSGAKIIGNYILGKTIGSGSYGKVHLGLHIITGQKVAVKIIDKQKLNKIQSERVQREINILKKILHPSLVQLYQIIQTPKSLLLFTQYIQNGQLFSYIINRQKLSEEESCKIFHQIIDGIQYLHSLGIAHRDIKPENILIDFDGRIKIIDFGLSNFYQKNEKLKTQCGSPCYVPPQMIGGHKYAPIMADIWSCGIVLFAMISGYLPFCDAHTQALYRKIEIGKYKCPIWMSQSAKDLISKILVVAPSKRAKLSQILQHPWYKKFQVKRSVGIDTRFFKAPVQAFIIEQIQKLGVGTKKLVSSIQFNLKSKQTALYYIIAKKLLKQKHKLVTFFNSNYFQPALVTSINKQQDQTAIESVFADVQTISPIEKDFQLNSPVTNTDNSLQFLKIAGLLDVISSIISINQEDPMITLMKNIFYAHNLQNRNPKMPLRSSKLIKNRQNGQNVKKKVYVDQISLKDIIKLPILNEIRGVVKNRNKSLNSISRQEDIKPKLRLPPSLTPYKTAFIKKK